jgi:hypothetical protein
MKRSPPADFTGHRAILLVEKELARGLRARGYSVIEGERARRAGSVEKNGAVVCGDAGMDNPSLGGRNPDFVNYAV